MRPHDPEVPVPWRPGTLVLLAGMTLALAGCGGEAQVVSIPNGARILLRLPEGGEYPHRERFAKLTVDGKVRPRPLPAEDLVTIDLDDDKAEVEVILSFWPVPYSNTFRRRIVPVGPGQLLIVDLRKEDPQWPDRIEAIFFQTPEALLDEEMKLAGVGGGDTVCDIGCGDGRLVVTAVKKYGAKRGIGYDIRPELVQLSRENAVRAGVADRTEFMVQDALKLKDLSHVSVVFLYLGEDLCARLRPLLQKTLKPGSRVVSLDFPIQGWEPDLKKEVKATNNYGNPQVFTLYLYRVK